MSETLLSPGVLTQESDKSLVTKKAAAIGAAIIGPTAKGPLVPTLVTSMNEYSTIYGDSVISGSSSYSYLTTISAKNYFSQGGQSLIVQRVVSGSFTSASSTVASQLNAASASFTLDTISKGTIMNSSGVENVSGSLTNGTSDNIRWEVQNVNDALGTFSLIVRQGDDTTRNKVVLETYNGLSLDPVSSNYIEKVIGNTIYNIRTEGTDIYVQNSGSYLNNSNYIIVSSVTAKTPNYLNNDGSIKSQYTSSLPVAGTSGSFSGATGDLFNGEAKFYENITATNVQGIHPDNYTSSIALLSNTDEYKSNLISAPGLNVSDHSAAVNRLVSVAEARQDCIAIVDLDGYGTTVGGITTAAAAINSSYAATYWPWLQTISNGQTVWVPASTMIPGVFAFSDKTTEPWFAPAGMQRGGLGNVIQAERKLTAGNKDSLYNVNVNPIATLPQAGVVVFGQKTLQKQSTALDRVNVRRLLITVKAYISQVASNLVFEQNATATRNTFLSQVNPYLESVQQKQGLYAFSVKMDDENNSATTIDRNELVGQIYLQPTKTVEYILLNFTVSPTGIVF